MVDKADTRGGSSDRVPECRAVCQGCCQDQRLGPQPMDICCGMALALVRNYDAFRAPTHFRSIDMLKKLDKGLGATGHDYGDVSGKRTMADILRRRRDRWNLLFVAGMWFQDLFNYDFRRTEQCIIPYATQEGEISFCAYNTGVGWRKSSRRCT